jgi:polyhydroxyalkanoate synthesis regulator phasin
VFIEVFRSEKYIRIQGRLLNTAMAYRIHQREIVELFLKIGDMPTRSEVDEAHRNIYEQRKEMKALKKALVEMSTSLKQQERVSQSEIDEARRNIDELRQEVQALRVALAETTAAAKAKSSTQRERPATKHKQAAAREVEAAASNSAEGGEHATVSGTDPA